MNNLLFIVCLHDDCGTIWTICSTRKFKSKVVSRTYKQTNINKPAVNKYHDSCMRRQLSVFFCLESNNKKDFVSFCNRIYSENIHFFMVRVFCFVIMIIISFDPNFTFSVNLRLFLLNIFYLLLWVFAIYVCI